MTTTIRIDDDLKRRCDDVFGELGLNMTTAVTIFLRQVVRTRTIPFTIGAQTVSDDVRLRDGRLAQMAFDKGRASRFAAGEREWTMDEINAEIAAAHTK